MLGSENTARDPHMSDLLLNDEGNFMQRLRRLQPASHEVVDVPGLEQWLQYWNDADSVAGNLRNLEHWLQRTRQ